MGGCGFFTNKLFRNAVFPLHFPTLSFSQMHVELICWAFQEIQDYFDIWENAFWEKNWENCIWENLVWKKLVLLWVYSQAGLGYSADGVICLMLFWNVYFTRYGKWTEILQATIFQHLFGLRHFASPINASVRSCLPLCKSIGLCTIK